MNTKELKDLYLKFFKSKGHAIVPSASLIPENDPTVLFTTAGMHPLVPYLMGQPHPEGNRIVDVQKCIRTVDIDAVGDPHHLTFFEMLGNWSLGDYFKKESIQWSYEFLTKKDLLNLPIENLSFTCFKGDENAPKDTEAEALWLELGIPKERIYFLPAEDNWWGPAGETGPCGPCSEIFYDTGRPPCSKGCDPSCSCGKFFEIWNNVFMEYNKNPDKTFTKLKQKNVDTGMGVERTVAVLNGFDSVYKTDIFTPLLQKIQSLTKTPNDESPRIIADHARFATFVLGDNRKIIPSNVDQGYILRRLIRRAVRHAKKLGLPSPFLGELATIIIDQYKDQYDELNTNKEFILDELKKEETRFSETLEKGLREFEKLAGDKKIEAKEAFLLFQSYGFPIEMTIEMAKEKNILVDEKGFQREFKAHQALSRTGAEKRFKGGLGDTSDASIKLHTATHLLNEALRIVLKDKSIKQKGSNITAERLRFDFNFPRRLTPEEKQAVEDMVNKLITDAIPVERLEMSFEEAKKLGAQMEFDTYPEKVSVYKIGSFSLELCGGPHVINTKDIGHFKIKKEESSAAGIRRIKAIVD